MERITFFKNHCYWNEKLLCKQKTSLRNCRLVLFYTISINRHPRPRHLRGLLRAKPHHRRDDLGGSGAFARSLRVNGLDVDDVGGDAPPARLLCQRGDQRFLRGLACRVRAHLCRGTNRQRDGQGEDAPPAAGDEMRDKCLEQVERCPRVLVEHEG